MQKDRLAIISIIVVIFILAIIGVGAYIGAISVNIPVKAVNSSVTSTIAPNKPIVSVSIPRYFNSDSGYSLNLSDYVRHELLSNYNSSREYSICLHGSLVDKTFVVDGILSGGYFFVGGATSSLSMCDSIVALHSHPDFDGSHCKPSSKGNSASPTSNDIDVWNDVAFQNVQIFAIQCHKNTIMLYLRDDIQKNIIKGYNYEI